jgi:palmitoyltransferase
MDGLSWAVEGLVYLIGPLLILLALSIISLLTYTFATIVLPMIQLKHAGSSLQYLYVGLHCSLVLFLFINTLFNYFLCVTTRHVGPKYDRVVRQLADASGILYPETPSQVALFRRDVEDRIVLRMRRRQARAMEQDAMAALPLVPNLLEGNTGSTTNGVTQRKVPPPQSTSSTTVKSSAPPKVRMWMLMGPFEWGYCGNTNQPKPPRSHYDHVSKQLVLNMDHYCPWMFNASKSGFARMS